MISKSYPCLTHLLSDRLHLFIRTPVDYNDSMGY
jgi:hypothetical protein